MKQFGALLMLVGAIAACAAFFMRTTVDTYSTNPLIGDHIINIGLLQDQMMVLHVGIGAFISGAVLAGAGAILERLSVGVTESPATATPSVEFEAPAGNPNLSFLIAAAILVVVLGSAIAFGIYNAPKTNSASANIDAEADNLANEADNLSDQAAKLARSR